VEMTLQELSISAPAVAMTASAIRIL
jgi:hypothetical protein